MLVAFSCSFSCVLSDRFCPLSETGETTRSVFVFPLWRSLSTTVFVLLYETDGNARNAFPLLRLTVDPVIELLIRILPHRLSDTSV